MGDNKTKYIGARFTEKEKKDLEKLAKDLGKSLSELIREALLSHYHLFSKPGIRQLEILLVKEV